MNWIKSSKYNKIKFLIRTFEKEKKIPYIFVNNDNFVNETFQFELQILIFERFLYFWFIANIEKKKKSTL